MTEKFSEQKKSPKEREPEVDERSRMGVFHIPGEMFQAKPELVHDVLRKLDFFPHTVRPIQNPPVMEYVGHSPKFDLLKQGDPIPTYMIQVRECDDGELVVEPARIEERRIIVPGR